MLTGYTSVSRGMILKVTLIPSIILKLQAQRGFLPKYMNPQSYKSQYMALPESNCWYKISAYIWQPTLDKPTSFSWAWQVLISAFLARWPTSNLFANFKWNFWSFENLKAKRDSFGAVLLKKKEFEISPSKFTWPTVQIFFKKLIITPKIAK